ncbi:hypothetical protein ACWATR_35785 [Nostoc sp. UIC 10890]
MKPKFQDWQFKSCSDTDGITWHWAEFYFQGEEGMLAGKSPMYAESGSDFHCLREDAPRIANQLREGMPWTEVCKKFREAW